MKNNLIPRRLHSAPAAVAGALPTWLLLLLSVGFTGCQELLQREVPDPGRISGGVYQNEFFGMEITVGSGWEVVPEEDVKADTDLFVAMVASGDRDKRDEVEQEFDATLHLLSLQQNSGTGLPYFEASAVDVRHQANLRTGRDVLEHSMQRTEELTRANRYFTFSHGNVSRGEIGGVTFYALPARWNLEGVEVRQFLYATVIDDYALFLNTTYQSNSERDRGRALTAGIRFDR